VIERGFHVVGVDAAPPMIALCRARFPNEEWHVANMTELALDRAFDGVLAWDSFFHLGMEEQRAMFSRFAAHAQPHAPLMFTSGSYEGEAIGTFGGDPLYHASLSPREYEQLLTNHGFVVREYMENDPECGNHTVWLAAHDT
jgi:cyclopropane fatty-acyl-phospholipid synthase-like methyltransferase